MYYHLMNYENLKRIIKRKVRGDFILNGGELCDILHVNSIEIIGRRIDGLCDEGNILLSSRELDLIGIMDIEKEQIVWAWGPDHLSKQHHPSLLKSDNILLFDNGVNQRRSRVLEINPYNKRMVWEYKSNPLNHFFSRTRGSAQRLPNGNTLITESDKGHVFEITENGKIVWEFYNPEIREEEEERAAIYRMMRIVDQHNYAHLRVFKSN